jgi:transcriptional regulator with XRE-family HTH domain
MELCDYIRQIRLKHGLTQKEFAEKLGITPMHASTIESPFEKVHRLPSDELLRKIAKEFSRTEEERKKIEEILLVERAKLIAAPEVRKYIGFTREESVEKPLYPKGESMPALFLKRLDNDLRVTELNDEFYAKAEIDRDTLKAVLRGEALLSRRQVIALAVALGQPVDEYLELTDFIPQHLKEMVEDNALMGIFRTLKEMTPDDMELVLQSISNILELYKRQKKEKKEKKKQQDKNITESTEDIAKADISDNSVCLEDVGNNSQEYPVEVQDREITSDNQEIS